MAHLLLVYKRSNQGTGSKTWTVSKWTPYSFLGDSHNARLSGEQRYHHTQLLHRKHKGQIKPKPPSVANPS
ncbi:hypothetical protein CGK01_23010 [Vibrio parahaemolyticus]|nr:hypothetical protein CGK01_23010 [Vibrio parahaemolyticus]